MRKGRQIWSLRVDEVERIKAGVLRYIQSSQNSKSKEKSSHASSTPRSPLKNGNAETLKKSKKKQNQSSYSFYEEKTYKLRSPPNMQQLGAMPKGFWLSKSGKILRTGQVQTKIMSESTKQKTKIKQESPVAKKKIIPPPPSLFQRTNSNQEILVTVSPESLLQKGIKTNEDNILPIEQIKPLPIQNIIAKTPEIIQKKQEPLEQAKPFSVLQLAKMFGGLTKQTSPLPPPEKKAPVVKAQLTDRSSVEKQITVHSGQKISLNQINSLASFGKSENSKGNQRISQFLDMRMAQNKKKQAQKQRKRSYTFQENVASHESQQLNIQQTNNLLKQTKRNIEKSSDQQKQPNKYVTSSMVSPAPHYKSIQFTGQQEQELKVKYSILSHKLDELKSKVLQECDYMQQARNKSKSPKQMRRQKIHLYHKYSPLKNLERIQYKKNQERQINQIETQRSRFKNFEKSLRFG